MKLRWLLSVLLVIVGLAAIAVGVIYLAVPAHSLPTWFPGHIHSLKDTNKHSTRGDAGVIVGAVLLISGAAVGLSGRRRQSHKRRSW